MEKIFVRTAQGAQIGGVIGAAIGVIIAAGCTAALGPVSIPAMCLIAGTTAVSSGTSAGAIGTLVGGGVGAVTGTAETVYDNNHCDNKEEML